MHYLRKLIHLYMVFLSCQIILVLPNFVYRRKLDIISPASVKVLNNPLPFSPACGSSLVSSFHPSYPSLPTHLVFEKDIFRFAPA